MISREDLEKISISIEDYGSGLYDGKLYYKGKLIATYPYSVYNGVVKGVVIDEENYQRLEFDEKIENELKECYPISLLTDEDIAAAKRIFESTDQFEAIQFIRNRIPDEGLKGAKIYFDLYVGEKLE